MELVKNLKLANSIGACTLIINTAVYIVSGPATIFYFLEASLFAICSVPLLLTVLHAAKAGTNTLTKVFVLTAAAIGTSAVCYVLARASINNTFTAEQFMLMCTLSILSALASLFIHKKELV